MKKLIKEYIKKLKENSKLIDFIKKVLVIFIIFFTFNIIIKSTDFSMLANIKEQEYIIEILKYKNLIYIISISLIFIYVYKNRFKIVAKLVDIGKLDINLYAIQISCIIYKILKLENADIILDICALSIIIQTIKICTILFLYKNEKVNVVDLKDFLEMPINSKRIYIKEDEPEYDLLQMNETLDKLYYAIAECTTKESFAMSLNGEWGSGKSTLIQNLKRKIRKENKDIIVIDDFNPWVYNNEKAVLIGIYENFMKKVGEEIGNKKIRKFFTATLKVVFENSDYEKAYKIVSNQFNSQKEMEYYKNLINTYLKINNKKILFVIDDLDRASNENILFLFNMIKNVLNFNNTIYLFSFDEEIVKNKLKEKVDYKFIEKIIQMQIKMPKVYKEIKNTLINKAIKKMLYIYTYNKREAFIEFIDESNRIDELIYNKIRDLRELKRILNSIGNYHINGEYLNIIDMFILQFIKIKNNRLYEKIWENRKWFVANEYTYFTIGDKQSQQRRTEIFNEIFDDVESEYIEIVAKLFPFVNMYRKGEKYRCAEKIDSNDKHIYNEKYIEMYFTEEKSNKLIVEEDIKLMLAEEKILVEKFENYDLNKKIEFSHILVINDFLEEKDLERLMKIFLKEAIQLADRDFFFYLDIIRRIRLEEINDTELIEIIKKQKDIYSLIILKKNTKNQKIKYLINKEIAKYKSRFMKKNQYIFKDALYKRNIFALNLKNEKVKLKIGRYINNENIYDYLKNINQMIREYTVGEIDERILKNAIEIKKVEDIIDNIKNKKIKSKNEKNVIKLYEMIKYVE